jgi:hypothetical protein
MPSSISAAWSSRLSHPAWHRRATARSAAMPVEPLRDNAGRLPSSGTCCRGLGGAASDSATLMAAGT